MQKQLNQVRVSANQNSRGGKRVRTRGADEPRGAIVTSSDLRSLSLVAAAVRLWELRNPGCALLVAGLMIAGGSVNAQEIECGNCQPTQAQVSAERAAMGKVADDESPCGAYVTDEDCEKAGETNDTTKGSQFVWAVVADTVSPCGEHIAEEDCERILAEDTDGWLSAWLGRDVDEESAEEEE